MDQDRTTWDAQDYAVALNSAATPTDLFHLVQEVNHKWGRRPDEPRRVVAGEEVREVRTSAASL
jgi:hypothetical protein